MTIDKKKKLKLSPNGISSKVTANSLMADNSPDNGAYLTYDSNGSILSWHTAVAGSMNHQDLLGLQGGDTNEYYHLTANNYNLVTGSLNNHFISTGSSVHGLGTISTQSASSVNITGGSVNNANFNYIGMGINAGSPTYAEGRLYWDNTDHTLALMTEKSNTVLQIGQEAFVRCVNKSGSLLADGTTVYLSGAQGNRPTVYPASASSDLTSRTIGVITADIPNNEEGYVTTLGLVRDFNTSAFDAGSPLYLSTTAGSLTQTRPVAPAHSALVAFSLNSTNNGSIFVNPDVGNDLSTLHDVIITTPTGGQILTYNSSGSYWINNNTITGSSGSPMLTVTNSGSTTAMFGTTNNGIIVDHNGFMTYNGSACYWNDISNTSLLNLKTGGANVPSLATFLGVLQQLAFADGDYVYGSVEILHDYFEGTDLSPHVHIATASVDGTDRFINWELVYSVSNATIYSAPPAYSFSGSAILTTGDVTIPANTAIRSHIIISLGTISGSGLKIGSVIAYRLRRITATGTAPSANPFGLSFSCHALHNSNGSRFIGTK